MQRQTEEQIAMRVSRNSIIVNLILSIGKFIAGAGWHVFPAAGAHFRSQAEGGFCVGREPVGFHIPFSVRVSCDWHLPARFAEQELERVLCFRGKYRGIEGGVSDD